MTKLAFDDCGGKYEVVEVVVIVVVEEVRKVVVVDDVVAAFVDSLTSALSSTSSKLAAMNGFSSSPSPILTPSTLILRVLLPTTSETSNDALMRRTLVVTSFPD